MVVLIVPGSWDEGTLPRRVLAVRPDSIHFASGSVETWEGTSSGASRYGDRSMMKGEPTYTVWSMSEHFLTTMLNVLVYV